MRKLILILFLLFSTYQCSKAFHIVGGEITYSYLGNDVYRIRLKLYRDCAQTNGAQYDTLLPLGVFNNSNLQYVQYIQFPGSTPVNDPVLAACIVPPGNVCVEEAIYETDITLPPISGGYDIVYQRCCRNSSIVNINVPDQTGATYLTHIDPSTSVINNAAYFNTLPPIFLCINTPFDYDHSATDPDGDVLVYSFCDPYSGADNNAPAPDPPSDPPYGTVSWSSGFSSTNQITSNPQLTINPTTGQITGTPTQFGQFVIGVKVSEYRNGVYIGETRRDFQFNILPCNNAIASIPAQQSFCTGLSVFFDNTSVNSTNYIWDFGDLTTNTDTSIQQTVTYTYPAPGSYTVSLIAYNPAGNCYDTAYSTFQVSPLLDPVYVAPPSQCLDNNSYNFSLGGSVDPSANYSWNFGQFAVPQSINLPTPTGIHFTIDTLHKLQIVVSQFGCTDTTDVTLELLPKPRAIIGDANRYCVGNQIDFDNLSTSADNYFWDFGVSNINIDISNLAQPSYIYPDTGIYSIQLIASNNFGCSDTTLIPFWVYPLFAPTIYPFNDSNYVNQCIDANSFNFYAAGVFSSAADFSWNFGVNASPNSSIQQDVANVTYNSVGFFPVTVTVEENGCVKSYTDSVRIYNRPQIGFELLSVEPCLPASISLKDTSYAETGITYIWTFGDGDSSFTANPTHIYTKDGTYNVNLTIITKTGCKDTLSLSYPGSFTFTPKPIPGIGIDSLRVSIFNPTINITDSSKQRVACKLILSDGTIYSQCNIQKTFTDTGYYTITQVVYSADGCTDTLKKVVYVVPEFRIWIPNAFTPNNDGNNDNFLPVMIGVRNFNFSVYNRWGTQIFNTEDKNVGWDGTSKNDVCPNGVYSYIFYYEDVFNRYQTSYGKVVLLR